MKASEIQKDWMTHDMRRVIQLLTINGQSPSETDLMRLKSIEQDGRLKDFSEFYRIARRVKEGLLQDSRNGKQTELNKSLSELEKQEVRAQREIEETHLSEGVSQSRQVLENQMKQELDQRKKEHRQQLSQLKEAHSQNMEQLWEETRAELKLLEEQVTLFSLRLETEPTLPDGVIVDMGKSDPDSLIDPIN